MSTDHAMTYTAEHAGRATLHAADHVAGALDTWTRELVTTPSAAVREALGAEAATLFSRGVPLWSLLESSAELELRPRTRRRVAALRAVIDRLALEPRPRPAPLQGPRDIASHFAHLAALPYEQFHALALDPKLRVVMAKCLSSGGVDGASVELPELLRFVLEVRGHGLVVVHNHPSGDPTPSQADRQLTAAIAAGAAAVGLHFRDHVVVGAGRAYSFTAAAEFAFQA